MTKEEAVFASMAGWPTCRPHRKQYDPDRGCRTCHMREKIRIGLVVTFFTGVVLLAGSLIWPILPFLLHVVLGLGLRGKIALLGLVMVVVSFFIAIKMEG